MHIGLKSEYGFSMFIWERAQLSLEIYYPFQICLEAGERLFLTFARLPWGHKNQPASADVGLISV